MERCELFHFSPLMLCIGLAAALVIGCATTAAPTPQQQGINAGVTSSTTLDQAVKATQAAFDTGLITKPDAAKALAGFAAGQAGIKAGVAVLSAASAPASSPGK